MDDKTWGTQWRGAENNCTAGIKAINTTLKLANSNQHVQPFLVDAVPVDAIKELCKQYTHVYIVSDQSGFAVPKNCTVYTLPESFYGTYYVDNLNLHDTIACDFNCFMNRMDAARQNWFYILYDRGWLNQGWVSFNIDLLNDSTDYPSNNQLEVFDYFHQTMLNSYDHLYSSVRSIVPYKNFVDTGNQFERTLETKFSIVMEPYFERPDSICFSEKTMRVLQLPRPWVLFGSTGSVSKLRGMGFDVFDDFVDHSYDAFDTQHSYVQRQNAMLIEIEKLLQLQPTPAIIDIWKQKAQYNRNILKTWSQSWPTDFSNLLDKISSDITQSS
jgi:hypothetical protein